MGDALFVLIVLAGLWWFWRLFRGRFSDRAALPADIRDARFYQTERHLSCKEPVPLKGTPDRVLQLPTGELVVTDLKTRLKQQVYDSDIIQLSVYRILLMRALQKRVKSVGYIVFRRRGRDHYVPVPLLREEQVVDLYTRYVALRRGERPHRLNRVAACRKCAYQVICQPACL